MRQNGRRTGNPLWRLAASAGLVLFLLIQVIPAVSGSDAGPSRVLSRDAAARDAQRIAWEKFGINAGRAGIDVTHMSDSTAVAYLSKEDLLKSYEKQWDDTRPTDVYRADVRLPDGSGALTLYLHMETGRLLGWRDGSSKAASGAAIVPSPQEGIAYASFWGISRSDWEWDGKVPDPGRPLTYIQRKGSALKDARVTLSVLVPPGFRPESSALPPWKSGSVTYGITVPPGFENYIEHQKNLAGKLNAYGFVIPQVLLLIAAIVYAASRRSKASAWRGIVLAAIFLVLYAAFYFNLIPGFRAGMLEQGQPADPSHVRSLLIVNLIVLAGMALFTCLSAIAGDGLWRSMGRNLWPRWREPGFGRAVLDGMRKGYPLAFILLGAQSVILAALENGIGMFQASDATQSSYNMTFPWLLLLLAWCAGISEELQSRLFGIALFRHWLLGAARRLLGREPSARAASALTLAAMLPPGLFWAFGHVGYAVYPAYSRLIELVIMGLLFGWFLLRFGLIAVIFAHVTLDSILMSVQLGFAGLPGGAAAAACGIVVPAAVGYAISRLHRIGNGKRPASAA